MDLRTGASAERRRRVLREDAGSGDAETTAPRRRTKVRIDPAHYPEAAQPHRQPRVVDLLPMKWWALALVAGAGASLATGALVGYAYLGSLAASLGEETLRPFDLARRGNLADWLSSWTLLGTALAAGIVYLLRRHRIDDYRGRYRAWPWTAGVIGLGAVDAAVGFHQSIAGGFVALTGIVVCGQGAFWWIAVEGLLLAAVSVALLREYLRCRVSLAALALAVLAYAGMAVAAVVRADVAPGPGALIAQEGFRLFGHLLLGGSVLLYARYVLREVQGLQKSTRKKRKTKADTGESRVPAPHLKLKSTKAREGSLAAPTAESTKPAAPKSPPPAPSNPEPARSSSAATPPPKPAADASRASGSTSSEVRRTDPPAKPNGPPAKPNGPLASKLRPTSDRVSASAGRGSSTDDEDENDDDRRSRKQKRRR